MEARMASPGRRTQARGAGRGPERRVTAEAKTRLDLSFQVPERPAVVHLRWLPLDLCEMGKIVEFASSGCSLGGGRIPERLP